MKKYLIILVVIVLRYNLSFSTEQVSDILIIENDTICLKSFPLEELKFKLRPFKYGDYDYPHTACWRGYFATWKVIDSKLFLMNVKKADSTEQELDIILYFKKNGYKPKIINGHIFANWFSGELETYFGFLGATTCIHKPKKKYTSRTIIKFKKGVMIENNYMK